jgi:hypothetical protein
VVFARRQAITNEDEVGEGEEQIVALGLAIDVGGQMTTRAFWRILSHATPIGDVSGREGRGAHRSTDSRAPSCCVPRISEKGVIAL